MSPQRAHQFVSARRPHQPAAVSYQYMAMGHKRQRRQQKSGTWTIRMSNGTIPYRRYGSGAAMSVVRAKIEHTGNMDALCGRVRTAPWSCHNSPHRRRTTQKESGLRIFKVPGFWRHCCRFRIADMDSYSLGPSHTTRRSVGFRAARQRLYKIPLLRPVCGICAARQLVLIFVASCQKHAKRGIELILCLTPDAWY